MRPFDVTVRNELTGEVATLSLTSYCFADAQVEALMECFSRHGWWKATALADASTGGAEGLCISGQRAE